MSKIHLSHKHAHTLQQIFQHPPSHNLEWHEVVSLLKQVGTAQEEANGHLTFALNGITEVFHPAKDKKDVSDVEQVLRIRHLLERGGVTHDGTMTADREDAAEEHPLHDQGRVNAEQNRGAEQQLKNQQSEQNERSAFQGGNAQAHQQGNRQK